MVHEWMGMQGLLVGPTDFEGHGQEFMSALPYSTQL